MRMGSGLQQQMGVVGHQDVGMEGDVISVAIALESLQIASVIFGVMKDRRPLVASRVYQSCLIDDKKLGESLVLRALTVPYL